MKKAISLFLFCIFLFNLVGYFVAFKATESQIKNEIKSKIKSGVTPDELVAITINKTDMAIIVLENDGTEMIYNNQRYDIVKNTETTTTITYYCISDLKETALFTALDEHINTNITTNQSSKNSVPKNLVKHIVKVFFLNKKNFFFDQYNELAFFSPVDLIHSTTFIKTNSPPPKFI